VPRSPAPKASVPARAPLRGRIVLLNKKVLTLFSVCVGVPSGRCSVIGPGGGERTFNATEGQRGCPYSDGDIGETSCPDLHTTPEKNGSGLTSTAACSHSIFGIICPSKATTVKVAELEVPPPGAELKTVIACCPTLMMSLLGT